MTTLDEFLTGVVSDCVNGGSGSLDIAADGPAAAPPTFTGNQAPHDIRAVQLRPENFSPAMIEKAGRLYLTDWHSYGPEDFEILGESGEWYHQRVYGRLVWLATCDCPARPNRWNKAGACAHRALAGFLRAEALGVSIPRWPSLTIVEGAS